MTKRTYQQFCPVARSLDVLGERWTLLILRDLLSGPRRYTDLRQGLPGMASNLLATRLAELADADLVERVELPPPAASTVYQLTERARGLEPALLDLARWGLPYLDAPTDDQPLLPHLARSGLKAMVHPGELPAHGLTVAFALDEQLATLVIEAERPPGSRLLPHDRLTVVDGLPGTEPDVTVVGSLAVLLWLRRGDLDGPEALDQGLISIDGTPEHRQLLARLFCFALD